MSEGREIPRFFVSFIKKRKGAFILVLFLKEHLGRENDSSDTFINI